MREEVVTASPALLPISPHAQRDVASSATRRTAVRCANGSTSSASLLEATSLDELGRPSTNLVDVVAGHRPARKDELRPSVLLRDRQTRCSTARCRRGLDRRVATDRSSATRSVCTARPAKAPKPLKGGPAGALTRSLPTNGSTIAASSASPTSARPCSASAWSAATGGTPLGHRRLALREQLCEEPHARGSVEQSLPRRRSRSRPSGTGRAQVLGATLGCSAAACPGPSRLSSANRICPSDGQGRLPGDGQFITLRGRLGGARRVVRVLLTGTSVTRDSRGTQPA